MTTTLFSSWRRSIIAALNLSALDEIEPCPDEFVQEALPISLDASVAECQKVSAELHAGMKALGIEE